jgi:hypothetical protein
LCHFKEIEFSTKIILIFGGVSNVRLAKIMEVADLLYLLDFKNLTDLNSLTFDASPNF